MTLTFCLELIFLVETLLVWNLWSRPYRVDHDARTFAVMKQCMWVIVFLVLTMLRLI